MFVIASSTSARDSRRGLPCSSEQSIAYSLTDRRISSVMRTPSLHRSRMGIWAIVSWAATAASTAAFASSAVPFGTVPRGSPDAGLTTSKDSSLSPVVQAPLTYILNLRPDSRLVTRFPVENPPRAARNIERHDNPCGTRSARERFCSSAPLSSGDLVRVLLLGSGAQGAVMAHHLARSEAVDEIVCADKARQQAEA